MIKVIENTSKSHQIAKMLLEIGAIQLNIEKPFSWSSGWNSPIYCDNRLSLSFPAIRSYIKNLLAEQVKTNYPDVEAIAGVATAGIPQGALVADSLELPFLYVRSKPKGHGMENMIEGKITKNQKVVLVEDLVSTGGSSLKAAAALKQAEFDILGMAAIFTYGFDVAEQNFGNANIPLFCLSDYNTLIDEALSQNLISGEQVAFLKSWREDPSTWNN
ncbi:orotate phosphoribosyltransferase [Fulvivirgaceae bacterium BMA12]|uniref:Orotate phosphoribosyltransferase n=1 Tax=Agaribacillus aureus TaxID=3051825 RepID=A0ABT8L5T2_9BACT|nr:orotate phosphoribosyltransferase [Fulvivirgaceae bacterium BMA12]